MGLNKASTVMRILSGFVLLFCMAMLITACGDDKNAEGLPVSEYNFFNEEALSALWGQPKNAVTGSMAIMKDSENFTIVKTRQLMHLQSSMIYGFDYYGRLDNIMYVFFDRSDSFGQYDASYKIIRNRLETIYGAPDTYVVDWKVDAGVQKAYEQKIGEAVAKEMATLKTEWNLTGTQITLIMLYEKLPLYSGVTIKVGYQSVKE